VIIAKKYLMDHQDKMLKAIRQKMAGTSLIDEIAAVLNISYDAAHRRISQKSKFSMEEAISLCTHYGLSMDGLFTASGKVIVEKTAEIRSLEDMETYLKQSAKNISGFSTMEGSKMYYSAKDLPLFYTVGGTLISKFKLYVWLNLLSGAQHQQPFEQFTVTRSLAEYGEALRTVYHALEVHEIWNDTTINSSLQQVHYYFKAGLLSLANALLLLDDLDAILHTAEDRCCNGTGSYHLYYNELLILNNNVLITAEKQQALFVPYTMLGYFITNDDTTCGNALSFFKQQVKNSMALNSSGTRDRKIFFNRAAQKIALYRQSMQNETEMGF